MMTQEELRAQAIKNFASGTDVLRGGNYLERRAKQEEEAEAEAEANNPGWLAAAGSGVDRLQASALGLLSKVSEAGGDEEMSRYLHGRMRNNIKEAQEVEKDLTFGQQALAMGVQVAPSLAASAIPGVGGAVAAGVLGGLQTAGDIVVRAEEEGLDVTGERAAGAATAAGITDLALARVPLARMLSKLPIGTAGRTVASGAGHGMASGAQQQVFANLALGVPWDKDIGVATVGGGMIGGGLSGFNAAMNYGYNDGGKEAMINLRRLREAPNNVKPADWLKKDYFEAENADHVFQEKLNSSDLNEVKQAIEDKMNFDTQYGSAKAFVNAQKLADEYNVPLTDASLGFNLENIDKTHSYGNAGESVGVSTSDQSKALRRNERGGVSTFRGHGAQKAGDTPESHKKNTQSRGKEALNHAKSTFTNNTQRIKDEYLGLQSTGAFKDNPALARQYTNLLNDLGTLDTIMRRMADGDKEHLGESVVAASRRVYENAAELGMLGHLKGINGKFDPVNDVLTIDYLERMLVNEYSSFHRGDPNLAKEFKGTGFSGMDMGLATVSLPLTITKRAIQGVGGSVATLSRQRGMHNRRTAAAERRKGLYQELASRPTQPPRSQDTVNLNQELPSGVSDQVVDTPDQVVDQVVSQDTTQDTGKFTLLPQTEPVGPREYTISDSPTLDYVSEADRQFPEVDPNTPEGKLSNMSEGAISDLESSGIDTGMNKTNLSGDVVSPKQRAAHDAERDAQRAEKLAIKSEENFSRAQAENASAESLDALKRAAKLHRQQAEEKLAEAARLKEEAEVVGDTPRTTPDLARTPDGKPGSKSESGKSPERVAADAAVDNLNRMKSQLTLMNNKKRQLIEKIEELENSGRKPEARKYREQYNKVDDDSRILASRIKEAEKDVSAKLDAADKADAPKPEPAPTISPERAAANEAQADLDNMKKEFANKEEELIQLAEKMEKMDGSEVAPHMARYEELAEEAQELMSRIGVAEKELGAKLAAADKADASSSKPESTESPERAAANEAQSRIDRMESQVSTIQDKKSELLESIRVLEEEGKSAQTAPLREQIKDLDADTEELNKRIAKTKEELGAHLDAADRAEAAKPDSAKTDQAEVDGLREEYDSLVKEQDALLADAEAAIKAGDYDRAEDLSYQINELDKDIDAAHKRWSDADEAVNGPSTIVEGDFVRETKPVGASKPSTTSTKPSEEVDTGPMDSTQPVDSQEPGLAPLPPKPIPGASRVERLQSQIDDAVKNAENKAAAAQRARDAGNDDLADLLQQQSNNSVKTAKRLQEQLDNELFMPSEKPAEFQQKEDAATKSEADESTAKDAKDAADAAEKSSKLPAKEPATVKAQREAKEKAEQEVKDALESEEAAKAAGDKETADDFNKLAARKQKEADEAAQKLKEAEEAAAAEHAERLKAEEAAKADLQSMEVPENPTATQIRDAKAKALRAEEAAVEAEVLASHAVAEGADPATLDVYNNNAARKRREATRAKLYADKMSAAAKRAADEKRISQSVSQFARESLPVPTTAKSRQALQQHKDALVAAEKAEVAAKEAEKAGKHGAAKIMAKKAADMRVKAENAKQRLLNEEAKAKEAAEQAAKDKEAAEKAEKEKSSKDTQELAEGESSKRKREEEEEEQRKESEKSEKPEKPAEVEKDKSTIVEEKVDSTRSEIIQRSDNDSGSTEEEATPQQRRMLPITGPLNKTIADVSSKPISARTPKEVAAMRSAKADLDKLNDTITEVSETTGADRDLIEDLIAENDYQINEPRFKQKVKKSVTDYQVAQKEAAKAGAQKTIDNLRAKNKELSQKLSEKPVPLTAQEKFEAKVRSKESALDTWREKYPEFTPEVEAEAMRRLGFSRGEDFNVQAVRKEALAVIKEQADAEMQQAGTMNRKGKLPVATARAQLEQIATERFGLTDPEITNYIRDNTEGFATGVPDTRYNEIYKHLVAKLEEKHAAESKVITEEDVKAGLVNRDLETATTDLNTLADSLGIGQEGLDHVEASLFKLGSTTVTPEQYRKIGGELFDIRKDQRKKEAARKEKAENAVADSKRKAKERAEERERKRQEKAAESTDMDTSAAKESLLKLGAELKVDPVVVRQIVDGMLPFDGPTPRATVNAISKELHKAKVTKGAGRSIKDAEAALKKVARGLPLGDTAQSIIDRKLASAKASVKPGQKAPVISDSVFNSAVDALYKAADDINSKTPSSEVLKDLEELATKLELDSSALTRAKVVTANNDLIDDKIVKELTDDLLKKFEIAEKERNAAAIKDKAREDSLLDRETSSRELKEISDGMSLGSIGDSIISKAVTVKGDFTAKEYDAALAALYKQNIANLKAEGSKKQVPQTTPKETAKLELDQLVGKLKLGQKGFNIVDGELAGKSSLSTQEYNTASKRLYDLANKEIDARVKREAEDKKRQDSLYDRASAKDQLNTLVDEMSLGEIGTSIVNKAVSKTGDFTGKDYDKALSDLFTQNIAKLKAEAKEKPPLPMTDAATARAELLSMSNKLVLGERGLNVVDGAVAGVDGLTAKEYNAVAKELHNMANKDIEYLVKERAREDAAKAKLAEKEAKLVSREESSRELKRLSDELGLGTQGHQIIDGNLGTGDKIDQSKVDAAYRAILKRSTTKLDEMEKELNKAKELSLQTTPRAEAEKVLNEISDSFGLGEKGSAIIKGGLGVSTDAIPNAKYDAVVKELYAAGRTELQRLGNEAKKLADKELEMVDRVDSFNELKAISDELKLGTIGTDKIKGILGTDSRVSKRSVDQAHKAIYDEHVIQTKARIAEAKKEADKLANLPETLPKQRAKDLLTNVYTQLELGDWGKNFVEGKLRLKSKITKEEHQAFTDALYTEANRRLKAAQTKAATLAASQKPALNRHNSANELEAMSKQMILGDEGKTIVDALRREQGELTEARYNTAVRDLHNLSRARIRDIASELEKESQRALGVIDRDQAKTTLYSLSDKMELGPEGRLLVDSAIGKVGDVTDAKYNAAISKLNARLIIKSDALEKARLAEEKRGRNLVDETTASSKLKELSTKLQLGKEGEDLVDRLLFGFDDDLTKKDFRNKAEELFELSDRKIKEAQDEADRLREEADALAAERAEAAQAEKDFTETKDSLLALSNKLKLGSEGKTIVESGLALKTKLTEEKANGIAKELYKLHAGKPEVRTTATARKELTELANELKLGDRGAKILDEAFAAYYKKGKPIKGMSVKLAKYEGIVKRLYAASEQKSTARTKEEAKTELQALAKKLSLGETALKNIEKNLQNTIMLSDKSYNDKVNKLFQTFSTKQKTLQGDVDALKKGIDALSEEYQAAKAAKPESNLLADQVKALVDAQNAARVEQLGKIETALAEVKQESVDAMKRIQEADARAERAEKALKDIENLRVQEQSLTDHLVNDLGFTKGNASVYVSERFSDKTAPATDSELAAMKSDAKKIRDAEEAERLRAEAQEAELLDEAVNNFNKEVEAADGATVKALLDEYVVNFDEVLSGTANQLSILAKQLEILTNAPSRRADFKMDERSIAAGEALASVIKKSIAMKEKYKDNPEWWLSFDDYNKIKRAFQGGESYSPYVGDLGRKLRAAVYGDAQWRDKSLTEVEINKRIVEAEGKFEELLLTDAEINRRKKDEGIDGDDDPTPPSGGTKVRITTKSGKTVNVRSRNSTRGGNTKGTTSGNTKSEPVVTPKETAPETPVEQVVTPKPETEASEGPVQSGALTESITPKPPKGKEPETNVEEVTPKKQEGALEDTIVSPELSGQRTALAKKGNDLGTLRSDLSTANRQLRSARNAPRSLSPAREKELTGNITRLENQIDSLVDEMSGTYKSFRDAGGSKEEFVTLSKLDVELGNKLESTYTPKTSGGEEGALAGELSSQAKPGGESARQSLLPDLQNHVGELQGLKMKLNLAKERGASSVEIGKIEGDIRDAIVKKNKAKKEYIDLGGTEEEFYKVVGFDSFFGETLSAKGKDHLLATLSTYKSTVDSTKRALKRLKGSKSNSSEARALLDTIEYNEKAMTDLYDTYAANGGTDENFIKATGLSKEVLAKLKGESADVVVEPTGKRKDLVNATIAEFKSSGDFENLSKLMKESYDVIAGKGGKKKAALAELKLMVESVHDRPLMGTVLQESLDKYREEGDAIYRSLAGAKTESSRLELEEKLTNHRQKAEKEAELHSESATKSWDAFLGATNAGDEVRGLLHYAEHMRLANTAEAKLKVADQLAESYAGRISNPNTTTSTQTSTKGALDSAMSPKETPAVKPEGVSGKQNILNEVSLHQEKVAAAKEALDKVPPKERLYDSGVVAGHKATIAESEKAMSDLYDTYIANGGTHASFVKATGLSKEDLGRFKGESPAKGSQKAPEEKGIDELLSEGGLSREVVGKFNYALVSAKSGKKEPLPLLEKVIQAAEPFDLPVMVRPEMVETANKNINNVVNKVLSANTAADKATHMGTLEKVASNYQSKVDNALEEVDTAWNAFEKARSNPNLTTLKKAEKLEEFLEAAENQQTMETALGIINAGIEKAKGSAPSVSPKGATTQTSKKTTAKQEPKQTPKQTPEPVSKGALFGSMDTPSQPGDVKSVREQLKGVTENTYPRDLVKSLDEVKKSGKYNEAELRPLINSFKTKLSVDKPIDENWLGELDTRIAKIVDDEDKNLVQKKAGLKAQAGILTRSINNGLEAMKKDWKLFERRRNGKTASLKETVEPLHKYITNDVNIATYQKGLDNIGNALDEMEGMYDL